MTNSSPLFFIDLNYFDFSARYTHTLTFSSTPILPHTFLSFTHTWAIVQTPLTPEACQFLGCLQPNEGSAVPGSNKESVWRARGYLIVLTTMNGKNKTKAIFPEAGLAINQVYLDIQTK